MYFGPKEPHSVSVEQMDHFEGKIPFLKLFILGTESFNKQTTSK
jgi:hypothetical protein